MRPLPVDVAVVPAAQLGGGELDERVSTALRAGSRLVRGQAVTSASMAVFTSAPPSASSSPRRMNTPP